MITLVVGPFAIWRYLNGEYTKAALNTAIVLLVLLHIAYTRRSSQTLVLITLAAIFYSCATVAIIHLNGEFHTIWLHPVILANFLLLPARSAAITSALAVVATLPVIFGAELIITALSVVASTVFSGSMAYTFARLTDQQRDLLSAAATEDALTQLGNRRLLDEELAMFKTKDKGRNRIELAHH